MAVHDSVGSTGRWRIGRLELRGGPVVLAAAAVLLLTIAVAVTLVRMRAGFLVRGDQSIELDANRAVLASHPLLTVARALGTVGSSLVRWVIAGVALLALAWRRQWRTAGWLAAAFLGGLLVTNGCRLAVDRPRPRLPHPVQPNPGGASFPSGHAMGSAVLFGALFVLAAALLPRALRIALGALVALLVAAIGASRVLVGLHFTSDVITGLVLGVAWLTLVTAAYPPWPDGWLRRSRPGERA
ncbi:MAG: phosphatase PAP2 family protein [Frankiaceae bacterium]